MSTTEVRTNNDVTKQAKVAKSDMKFEIVVIPVSDIDRAKEFYGEKLGWRLDADYDNGKDFRVIQFTPPGSGCSIIFGKTVTVAAPGSVQGLYIIVSDIEAARKELLWARHPDQPGVPRRRWCVRWNRRTIPVWADTGQRSGS
jgi:catechol 2,3-dioxygenase-like lactoylglutathione lyase family enzyme